MPMIYATFPATAGVAANGQAYLFSEMLSGVYKNGCGRNTRSENNERYGANRLYGLLLCGYA